jgi:hypothetical protein
MVEIYLEVLESCSSTIVTYGGGERKKAAYAQMQGIVCDLYVFGWQAAVLT